jgi:hypothetical protein
MTKAIARDLIYRRRRFELEFIELCAGRPARSSHPRRTRAFRNSVYPSVCSSLSPVSAVGFGMLRTRRDNRIDPPIDQLVPFHLAERLREHLHSGTDRLDRLTPVLD